MKLTTRAHYSVKALLDLTFQPGYGPASVQTIAQRQGLPAAYLEKLLIEMRRSNIVVSIRGSQGGYQLSRHPSKISLGEILVAVGEAIEPLGKHQPKDQKDVEDYVTFAVWNRLHQKLEDALMGISLEDLYFDARSWQASQGGETGFVI